MLLSGTLQPGATLSPPAPPAVPAPVIDVIGGQMRVGAIVTVSNTNGRPCYVQVCAPGTEGFDDPFIELNLDDPVPMFTLTADHLGHNLQVISKGLDAAGRPNGVDAVSNVLGPVLHAVDPVGTTVANATEFASAVAAGASTIILAAGTEWSGTVFDRNLSDVRITTPQDNPARIVDSYMRPGTWTNVVLEGLVFRHSAAWALANRSNIMQTGATSDGITFRGCKQLGDNVAPAVYQAIPCLLYTSPSPRDS